MVFRTESAPRTEDDGEREKVVEQVLLFSPEAPALAAFCLD